MNIICRHLQEIAFSYFVKNLIFTGLFLLCFEIDPRMQLPLLYRCKLLDNIASCPFSDLDVSSLSVSLRSSTLSGCYSTNCINEESDRVAF